MTIRFEVPTNVEEALKADGPDPSLAAREAVMVDLYRRELISHGQFARALDLCRCEADGVLKRHGVLHVYTDEEFEAEMAYARTLVRP